MKQTIAFGVAVMVVITMVHPVSYATTLYAGGDYFDVSHWVVWFQKDMWTNNYGKPFMEMIGHAIWKKFAFWEYPLFDGAAKPEESSTEKQATFASNLSTVLAVFTAIIRYTLVPFVTYLLQGVITADKERFSLLYLYAQKNVDDTLADMVEDGPRKDLTTHVAAINGGITVVFDEYHTKTPAQDPSGRNPVPSSQIENHLGQLTTNYRVTPPDL